MNSSSVSVLAATTLLFAGCSLFGSHHDPAAPPPPSGGNETRYWDAQRNQWVAHTGEGTSASPESAPVAGEKPPEPAAQPAPTPRPARATGVYNSSTGKIEWQANGYASAPQPAPAPAKHWWWPF